MMLAPAMLAPATQLAAQPSAVGSVRRRAAFTLIELLVVMVIIAIVAAMMAFALQAAQERAREVRTIAIIKKIDDIIAPRMMTYETRRVPMPEGGGDRKSVALARLNGLRDLMRLEFPERWSDVKTEPSTGVTRPAASKSYSNWFRRISDGSPNKGEIDTFQSAEALYMIVNTNFGGLPGERESFQESEIGDVDQDGFPEIIDAWGTPILFLRWAPSFPSKLQEDARNDPKSYPDPWDTGGVDSDRKTFRLYPVILSAGGDRQYDILRKFDGNLSDPFDGARERIGEAEDQDSLGRGEDGNLNHYDNIHNHLNRG
jgi:prepilin-type N-terminal cleavage/methylation domain-containing protein